MGYSNLFKTGREGSEVNIISGRSHWNKTHREVKRRKNSNTDTYTTDDSINIFEFSSELSSPRIIFTDITCSIIDGDNNCLKFLLLFERPGIPPCVRSIGTIDPIL